MAIFFAVVGLEISREATTGELRDKRTVAVPALGALGGLLVPVLIYLAFNGGTDAAHGWGVVMSTDTAFLVGILALFGPKCPDRLRLFLLTLAIVDDIGAITVMSIFYTDEVDMAALALAAAIVVGILVLRWLKVWQLAPYVVAGIALWFAVQASGVHATLAGVIIGLLVPARPPDQETIDEVAGYGRKLIDDATAEREHLAELAARAAVPTSDRLQRILHPWSAFVVVPLFGLANAGIQLDAGVPAGRRAVPAGHRRRRRARARQRHRHHRRGHPGAPARARASCPDACAGGTCWAAPCSPGIGFTISLFIAELAFDDAAAPGQREDRHPRRVAHGRGARLDPAALARREAAAVLAAQRRPAAAAPAAVAGAGVSTCTAPSRGDHPAVARPEHEYATMRRVPSRPTRVDPPVLKKSRPTATATRTITFWLPTTALDGATSVVGTFNGWTPGLHPLRRRSNGTMSTSVTVPVGSTIRFRYLGEQGRWFDDADADEVTAEGSVVHA